MGVYVLVLEGVGFKVLVGDGDTGGPGSQGCPSEQLPRLVKTKLISFAIGSNPQIYIVFLSGSLLAIISKLCCTLLQSLYQTVPNGGIGLILYIGY